MSSNDELAVTYASLILHDGNAPITAEKLAEVCQAAGVTVAKHWPKLFAKILATKDLDDLITNVGGAPAAAGMFNGRLL